MHASVRVAGKGKHTARTMTLAQVAPTRHMNHQVGLWQRAREFLSSPVSCAAKTAPVDLATVCRPVAHAQFGLIFAHTYSGGGGGGGASISGAFVREPGGATRARERPLGPCARASIARERRAQRRSARAASFANRPSTRRCRRFVARALATTALLHTYTHTIKKVCLPFT